MKFYISVNDKQTIKKYYPELTNKRLAVINVPEYCNKNQYIDYKNNKIQQYILMNSIKKMFLSYYKSKRFDSLLYIVEDVTEDLLYDIHSFVKDNKIYFTDYILIDCMDEINHELYSLFNNVL